MFDYSKVGKFNVYFMDYSENALKLDPLMSEAKYCKSNEWYSEFREKMRAHKGVPGNTYIADYKGVTHFKPKNKKEVDVLSYVYDTRMIVLEDKEGFMKFVDKTVSIDDTFSMIKSIVNLISTYCSRKRKIELTFLDEDIYYINESLGMDIKDVIVDKIKEVFKGKIKIVCLDK